MISSEEGMIGGTKMEGFETNGGEESNDWMVSTASGVGVLLTLGALEEILERGISPNFDEKSRLGGEGRTVGEEGPRSEEGRMRIEGGFVPFSESTAGLMSHNWVLEGTRMFDGGLKETREAVKSQNGGS